MTTLANSALKALTIFVLLTCFLPNTASADEGFFCIPDIPGESEDVRHEDCIDLLTWSWGINATFSQTTFSVDEENLVIDKLVDLASPVFFEKLVGGATLGAGTLHIYRDCCADAPYLVYNLEQFKVLGLHQNGDDQGPTRENVSLEIQVFEMCHTEFNDDGSIAGETCTSWDAQAGS